MKEEFRILSTTAILGYGFPKESFDEGMKRKPDLIAVSTPGLLIPAPSIWARAFPLPTAAR